MNKKLLFLDIDGTLTEPGFNTPPDSVKNLSVSDIDRSLLDDIIADHYIRNQKYKELDHSRNRIKNARLIKNKQYYKNCQYYQYSVSCFLLFLCHIISSFNS